ncbi:uncharacterized protein LOC132067123 isoform X1 [Lycium ferocissimum]|uniref:uncharacterized protein LOC132067123 isoform X1 n=1 Tax=Lycium ferocissimum TaxID=112874 RepID=UPI002814985B|nr:uncharacterized protein LOC132067123 isoform X1 [Lycium ferocissimum]XP_059316232.1 uncharacterized protein LOC132067123 isoform X1 [Lycium ferocissimum]
MPKDKRVNSFSFNRARTSPYTCSSKNSDPESQKSLPPVGNEREWEEARCPICMEHPHNAVLLLCSSRDKGCQPYMCDTSHRHSNCLDQFYKSQALSGATRSHVKQQPELACPLCRGHIEGWIVVEAARNFMNSKTRSCALETCNFTGNYAELRKHARREHPSERPCEADPTRQSEWTRLEHQRNFEDDFSEYQAPSDDDSSGDDFLTELSLDGGLFDSETEEGLDEDINISLDFELQTDFEDAFSESDDDSSEDDFLTEQPLDGGVLDSEAEEGLDEDINISLDFEFELSFSFPSEFPSMPRARDRSPSYARGGNTYQSESGARSQNRRSRRSASSSDNHERRPTATRSTNLSSRRTPSTQSSSREQRRNR